MNNDIKNAAVAVALSGKSFTVPFTKWVCRFYTGPVFGFGFGLGDHVYTFAVQSHFEQGINLIFNKVTYDELIEDANDNFIFSKVTDDELIEDIQVQVDNDYKW